MDKLIQIFNGSLQTGYIDKTVLSSLAYQPELLVNQKAPPKKVLSSILEELENCNQFFISVAFVTTSGVATIINALKELESRNIRGEILVSQYLNFTQPEALRRLARFNNISLRIATTGNAHSKGYIFRHKNHYNVIVGSSNLTAQALSTNKEWNMKVSALEGSGLVEKVLNEFRIDFECGIPVNDEFLLSYENLYNSQFLLSKQSINNDSRNNQIVVTPNSMQMEALTNLNVLRTNGKNKALLISATGTGKTYLSAFDAKAFNPKRLLFVVHRLTIAKEALRTFAKVFGPNKSMGLYSGENRELECDFVFSTVQTISRESHLQNFVKDHFDYIIVDETHRSGADSYIRVLNHFEPKFLLGMTATPERTDGFDIFQLFDHNIAYEIRLNRAMEEDMLSSFHYYGVTDLSVHGILLEKRSSFNLLVSDERVSRIIEAARFYGTDNGLTRGLVFCSRTMEAIELSCMFNLRGLRTVALIGDSSEQERANAIERLESDSLSDKLDYIFTVDVFNEGIDIPSVNQIIMLRPTESAIIFIQQLGRGLRKVDGKSYVTVIDFIGNYENNYLIPIALYGDTSYNKDSLRKLITEGSRMIPGASTINFDLITKEKIFKSIDSSNMQLFANLKKDYRLLKFKIGKVPMMMDFILHGSRDPYLYVNESGSYYNFVIRVEEGFQADLSKLQVKLLELFSKEINNSKRVEESTIIKALLEHGSLSLEELRGTIAEKYEYTISDDTIHSCIANLNFEFVREKKDGRLLTVREIYDLEIVKLDNGNIIFSEFFNSCLINERFRQFLADSIDYSIYQFDILFDRAAWHDGFVLYRKYSRKDVFRILNVSINPVAQNVGGYLVSPDNSHCPIFVNYHKDDDISESTKYVDEFVNNSEFDWMSKSNRSIQSSDVQSILGKNGTIRLPLFIKKNNDEGMDFYYMGDVFPELDKVEQTSMKNDHGISLPVVKIRFNLKNPVSTAMYNYLQASLTQKMDKSSTQEQRVSIDLYNNDEEVFVHPIPLYNFYAAAGSFSEMQSHRDFTFIEGPEQTALNTDYFACKIIGESMNRIIPNGSICLFKMYKGGDRNGKIVLVEHMDRQDQDFNSAFTIKTYTSEKVILDNEWKHTSIILRPNSFDDNYKDLIIDEENAAEMKVVGEFVKVLA
jgi:superfamily II DNA or RNA helicase/HKD family nuclease